MITETLHAPGQFEIPLRADTPPGFIKKLVKYGHFVITPQRVDPRTYDDATIKSIARYSGVFDRITQNEDGSYIAFGKGMWVWLGDLSARIGPAIRTPVNLSGANLASALSALISTLNTGTVTEPGGTTDGLYDLGEFPSDAVRTVLLDMGAEMRINPDGTYDAGPASSLFNTNAPLYVATARGGSDPNFRSIQLIDVESSRDYEEHANQVIVVETTSSETRSITGTAGTTGPEYNFIGALVDRTYVANATTDNSVTPSNFASGELGNHGETREMRVVTAQTEIARGSFRVGDAFYVYRPPTIFDTANQISYRGNLIFPAIERLLTASWPVSHYMGVLFRPPLISVAGSDYLNFSPYVDYEA